VNDLSAALRYVLGIGVHARAAVGQVDLDTAIVSVAHDVECGTHSGIPPCCIAWFMLVRKHMVPGSPEWLAYERTLRAARPKRRGHVGYATCPTCIAARRFVRVRSCTCSRASDKTIEGISRGWRSRSVR